MDYDKRNTNASIAPSTSAINPTVKNIKSKNIPKSPILDTDTSSDIVISPQNERNTKKYENVTHDTSVTFPKGFYILHIIFYIITSNTVTFFVMKDPGKACLLHNFHKRRNNFSTN